MMRPYLVASTILATTIYWENLQIATSDDNETCLNGGSWSYLWGWCDCASGYSGSQCEKIVSTTTVTSTTKESLKGCGDTNYEITSDGILVSPNYPRMYPNNEDCSNLIKVEDGKIIRISPIDFLVGRQQPTCPDSLQIYDGEDVSAPIIGKAMCGRKIQNPPWIESTGNAMLVRFQSDGGRGKDDLGYRLTIQVISRCYCENKNGGGMRGHWLCENDEKFERSDGCGSGEWCTGPSTMGNATFDHTSLCKKGSDVMDQNNFKCRCLHQNGNPLKNGITCGIVEEINKIFVGDYQQMSYCEMEEWCTGPFQKNESVHGMNYGKLQLCTKAKFSCGNGQMVPSCAVCPKNNDTIFHSWCSGYCKFNIDMESCQPRSDYIQLYDHGCADQGEKFETLNDAFTACTSNRKCVGIWDGSCDNDNEFILCLGGIEMNTHGITSSCIYKKDKRSTFPGEFAPLDPSISCKNDDRRNLHNFEFPSKDHANKSVALFQCEKYCSNDNRCWGCSLSCRPFCHWSAIESCETEKTIAESVNTTTLQKLVCVDVKIKSYKTRTKLLRWGLGPCRGMDEWKNMYGMDRYYKTSVFTERCCIKPGKHILTCSTSDFSLGWPDTVIEIEGHTYCDDFVSIKAIRDVTIQTPSLPSIDVSSKTLFDPKEGIIGCRSNGNCPAGFYCNYGIEYPGRCVEGNYTVICRMSCLDIGDSYASLTKAILMCNFDIKCIGLKYEMNPKHGGDQTYYICLGRIYRESEYCVYKKNLPFEIINHDIIPLPPENGCPGGTIGCSDGNCPNTCYCEDHCSWEKCVLEEPPDDCLFHINGRWVWDTNRMFWVAQFKEKFTKVKNTGCFGKGRPDEDDSSLQVAISRCASNDSCSGVYHTCCTDKCQEYGNILKGFVYAYSVDSGFEDIHMTSRLQYCPEHSIVETNLTRKDFGHSGSHDFFQQCTYQKKGRLDSYFDQMTTKITHATSISQSVAWKDQSSIPSLREGEAPKFERKKARADMLYAILSGIFGGIIVVYICHAPKEVFANPKILLERFKNIFQVVCFLLAAYMVLKLSTQFIENKDATSIMYREYNKRVQDKYPTFSICFEGNEIHWYHDLSIFGAFGVTTIDYERMLAGQPSFRYIYNRTSRLYKKTLIEMIEGSSRDLDLFHLQMEDILVKSEFETENPNHAVYYGSGSKKNIKNRPPFYVGYQTSSMICFTRESNDPVGLIRLHDLLSINSSILDSTAFKKSNVQIFVHYPNQLLQSIKNPTFSSSFSEYQFNKLLELKISQGTLLRKRPDSNDRCYENIQDHDMHLQMKMSRNFGCIPPYWSNDLMKTSKLGMCKSPSKLRMIHSYVQSNQSDWKYYHPSCLEMFNSVTYNWKETNNKDLGLIKLKHPNPKQMLPLIYPDFEKEYHWEIKHSFNVSLIKFIYTDRQYEEIEYAQDFAFESFWSGIGGFAGLFVGFSLMQLPSIMGNASRQLMVLAIAIYKYLISVTKSTRGLRTPTRNMKRSLNVKDARFENKNYSGSRHVNQDLRRFVDSRFLDIESQLAEIRAELRKN